jgi:hypothetical protein
MTHTPTQIASWQRRPYSWSQHSSWQYDKHAWYDRYILGNSTPSTPALEFGKKFADSIEWGTPMAPVTTLPIVEHPMTAQLDSLELVGYLDTWHQEELILGEFKTGVKKWDQKRVDAHGQLTYYALMHYLRDKVKPEDITMFLEWVPTCVRPDFTYGFTTPAVIHHFNTRRTLRQVLELAVEIKTTRIEMEAYIKKLST